MGYNKRGSTNVGRTFEATTVFVRKAGIDARVALREQGHDMYELWDSVDITSITLEKYLEGWYKEKFGYISWEKARPYRSVIVQNRVEFNRNNRWLQGNTKIGCEIIDKSRIELIKGGLGSVEPNMFTGIAGAAAFLGSAGPSCYLEVYSHDDETYRKVAQMILDAASQLI